MSQSIQYDTISEACNYERMDFWDARYLELSDTFEWYCDYHRIRPWISTYCPDKDGTTLVLGCGNSNLSHDMHCHGYSQIKNVDFSRVAIHQMSEKYRDICPELSWMQMDCVHTSFDDDEFDYAIDKATFDCMFCADKVKVREYCQEVDRVLKPGGVWIIVSNREPESRLEYLENGNVMSDEFLSLDCWKVHRMKKIPNTDHVVGKNDWYYVYVCRKDPAKAQRKKRMKNLEFR